MSERWAQSFSAQLVRVAGSSGLALTAETGIGAGGGLRTRLFRDWAGLQSVGSAVGKAAVFAAEGRSRWVCIEAHFRLNAPGASAEAHDGALVGQVRPSFLVSLEITAVAEATTKALGSRLGSKRADAHSISQAWQSRVLASRALLKLLGDELLSDDAIEACLTVLVENWPVGAGEQGRFLSPLSRWRRR